MAYRTRLGVGYDFRDAASTRCAGVECAVEDDHEVVFPVARDDTETFYVGVHNARVGTPGGTLGPRERARFDAPMTYEIRAVASSEDAPACFRACRGRGACVFGTAPACASRRRILRRVVRNTSRETRARARRRPRRRRDGVSRRGSVRVLRVGRSTRREDARGDARVPRARSRALRVFLKRDTVPTYCGSVSGAVAGCEDDFDASDADGEENGFPGGESNTTWLPDGTARTSRTTRVDPPREGGPFVGRVGRAAPRRHVRRRRDQPRTFSRREDDERDRPRTSSRRRRRRRKTSSVVRRGTQRVGSQGAVGACAPRESAVVGAVPRAGCGGRGTCDETTGTCACDPGYFGRGCAARVDTLAANAAPALVAPLALGEFVFFRFEVNCEGWRRSRRASERSVRREPNPRRRRRRGDRTRRASRRVTDHRRRRVSRRRRRRRGRRRRDDRTRRRRTRRVLRRRARLRRRRVAPVSSRARGGGFENTRSIQRVPTRGRKIDRRDRTRERDDVRAFGARSGRRRLAPAGFFEPAYGACGDDVRSCYLGDAHSSGRVADLPQAFGRGPVRGRVVLARSAPRVNDRRYPTLSTATFGNGKVRSTERETATTRHGTATRTRPRGTDGQLRRRRD